MGGQALFLISLCRVIFMSSQATINQMAGNVKDIESQMEGNASTIRRLQGEVAARQAEVETVRTELARREDSWRDQRAALEAEKKRLGRKLNDSVR